MKVMHLNSYYATGIFYKNLYDEQVKRGIDIDVFVSTSTPANYDLGEYTTVSRNHYKFDRYLFHLKHFKIYKDIKKQYKMSDYAVVHAHSLFSNGYIAMKIKRDFGVPYIVAVRDTDINPFLKYMIYLRKLGINILKEAAKIIFLSTSYRDEVIEKYIPDKLKNEVLSKCQIIPNGVDAFWLENQGAPKILPNNKRLHLLYVGQINKRKNIISTIKAIKILQSQGFDVEFTIVGKIQNETVYNQFKGEAFLKYISQTSKEELIKIYRDHDIFVMPSITETFGLVYPEAMSQGLPVIYTRKQGFDGQFTDGEVGFAVNCFDSKEIAEKIIEITTIYNDLSKNSLLKFQKFCWQDIEQEYLKIYDAIQSK